MARVLALALITDRDSSETVLEFAAPIVDSIEFHTPQAQRAEEGS
jgi:hypothetical protein